MSPSAEEHPYDLADKEIARLPRMVRVTLASKIVLSDSRDPSSHRCAGFKCTGVLRFR